MSDARGVPRVDVMIPTLNEADHIREAVENASRLGAVYVLDSMSTDGTQELARQAGATVVEHRFVDYADQKNWGLTNLPFTSDWIFILDADERITPQLRIEILRRVGEGEEVAGYFVNRILLFMGRAIKHGGFYPSWNLRLFRRGMARYESRAVHEHMMCDGPTTYLKEPMLHIRREPIARYLDKHIKYADLESDEWVNLKLGRSTVADARVLFRDFWKYRQWLRREIWPRTPLRPFWRFVYMYFWKIGFLDGRAGYHLARLMASYEYMISLLYRDKLALEQRRRLARLRH